MIKRFNIIIYEASCGMTEEQQTGSVRNTMSTKVNLTAQKTYFSSFCKPERAGKSSVMSSFSYRAF